MAELTQEQRRAVAIASARKRQAESQGGGFRNPLDVVNQGIAGAVDALAGPVNRGINRVTGAGLRETPMGDIFDAAGIHRRTPETIGEHALAGAGEAAAYMAPGLGVMQAVGRGAGIAGQAARTMAAPFTAAPISAMGAEMAAGAGARAAGEAATQGGVPNALRPFAEVAGGLTAGGAAYGVNRALGYAASMPVMRKIASGVAQAAAPFSPPGARGIVEDSLRRSSADPERAADRLMLEENLGDLSPAQQTGEPGVMAMERGFAARDPALAERLAERTARSRESLIGAAREGTDGRTVRDVQQFFRDRMARHEEAVSRIVRQAERRADVALRRVEPQSRSTANSEIVRGEIDKAFAQARAEEKRLWDRVPRNVEVPTAQARAALREALDEATEVSRDSIPYKARQFLGEDGFGETESMARLHRLYSEMRQSARVAMSQSAPDEFTARQANRIAEAILLDIEAAEPASNAARLLADARAYSRTMAEQFGQGNVGRALAQRRTGDDAVRSELTLDATIGRGGNAGAVAVDDIRRATGSRADPAMTDYMRERFTDQAVRGGRVDPARAESFQRQNREMISRFPDDFEPDMQRAIDAARTADRATARAAEAVAALRNPKAGGQVGFANAKAAQAVARSIFDADNPARAARAIARAAARDPTGDAVLGLKAGVIDEVIGRAMTGRNLTGAALADELAKPQTVQVLSATLSPAEISRLRRVAAQLRKIDAWDSVTPADLENAPNMVISTFMQIQAAKAGRAMGTGTIQVPGMMVRRVRDLMGRVSVDHADALMREAIEDPSLMAALLVGPGSSRAQMRQAEQRLTTWAIGTLAASGEDE